ncbi:MAG: hypothetical protein V4596_06390 [Bdellovibrionota bacterium]
MSVDYIKAIVLCLGFGSFFIMQALKRQKRVRQIQDTPKSKIASAPQGLVEIQGFAWPSEKGFVTPQGHELVYYHFSLEREESKGSGKHKKRVWVSVFSHTHAKPFYLIDPTGLAMVDASTSEMEIEARSARLWTSLKSLEQNHFLETLIPTTIPNFPPKGRFYGLFSQRYRVVEREIRAGCPIYVTGDFRTQNAEAKKIKAEGLTHFANRIIDFNSRSFKNLKALLDKNGDGKICHKEARDGYSFAAQLSQKKTKAENLTESEFEVFGEIKCASNHKLFLADAHEDHVVEKLKRGHHIRVFGGSALVTVGMVLTLRLFISDAAIEQSMKIKTQVEQESKEQALAKEKTKQVNNLHMNCVSGNGDACAKLVDMKTDYNLSSTYVEYYTKSACRLGYANFCETLKNSDKRIPASSTNGSSSLNP